MAGDNKNLDVLKQEIARKRRSRRPRSSGQAKLAGTGQTVSQDRAKRTTMQAGPLEPKQSMKHAKKMHLRSGVQSAAKQPTNTILDTYGAGMGKKSVQGYLNGSDIAEFAVSEDFENIVMFAQGVLICAYKLNPMMLANPTSATASPQAEIITPTDFVAYCCMAILRAYSKVGQLDSSFAAALDNFSDDFRVPVPIAEYIRHCLKVVGAPCIARRLTYDTDWTISTGQIIYNAQASSSIEIGYNHWGAETNLNFFEVWPYQVVNGSQQDLVTYSVSENFNLLSVGGGRQSWASTRLNAVAAYFSTTSSFKLNSVLFGTIPLTTTDYSGFAGPESGKTWAEAGVVLSPGARFNSDITLYVRPKATDTQYYPGFSYFGTVNPPSVRVQGGPYSNSFSGSGAYYGQPVVPFFLTRVAQVMQTLNHILLSESGMKREIFGHNGYKYCGLLVSNLNRINYVPIDVAGIVGKMVRAVVVACNNYGPSGLALPAGLLNAIVALAQGCVIRKILTAGQFEFLISLNTQPAPGGSLSNLWNVQALIPSMDYLTTELPLPWINILDAIGPSYYDGSLCVPQFGQTMAQSWSAASGAAKYNNFPKFGFISSSAGTYPPNLVPFAATNTDPTKYQFPYVWLSNPVGATVADASYWYGNNSLVLNWNEQATYPTTSASTALIPSATGGVAPLFRAATQYVYNASVQSTYASENATAGGRETHMAFQYAEVSMSLTCIASLFKDNTKTCKGYSMRPIQQSLGNVGMNCVTLSTVDNGFNRNYDALSVYVGDEVGVNPPNPVYLQLSVTMGPAENDVIHSNVFLTNSRVWLVSTLGINTQYLVPATRPQQLSAYTKSGYVTRLVGQNSMNLWTEWCVKCAQEGSEPNKEIQKALEKPHSMDHFEKGIATGRISQSTKSGVAQGVLLDNAIESQFTYGSQEFTVAMVERAFGEAKLRGYPNQITAAYNALHRIATLRCSDDFSANSLYQGIKKGLKTVLPVVKGVSELALAFI